MMIVTVVCENPGCSRRGEPRTVGLPHLGQDVHLSGGLRCGCTPACEMRIVSARSDG